MAEVRNGSDAERRPRRNPALKTIAFAVVLLAIVGSAYYVQTTIYNGPGVGGIAAFICMLAGLAFVLMMG
jgi:hypothetical protein